MADDAMVVILFTCTLIVFICVWILNPLTIAAILRSHTIRTSYSNIFILNLAVADLLLITMAVTLTGQQVAGNDEETPVMCILKAVTFATLLMGSILSSFAIAVDRFLYIAKPMRYPVIVTRFRVLGSLVVIWLLALVNSFLPFYRETGFRETGCFDEPTKTDGMGIISMAVTASVFVVLQVISTCMYIKMFQIIKKHHKLVESLSMSKSQSVSSSKDSKTVRPPYRYRAAKSLSNNCDNSSAPDVGLESSNASSFSQYDVDFQHEVNKYSSDVTGSDQADVQQSDISSQDDKQNVISENKDELLNYYGNGTHSPVAPFRIENQNGGEPGTDRKVKAVYHIPFSIRMKKFTSASRQSWSPGEESQSTPRISGRKRVRRCKSKYSLRDFRTIKTLMLMGNTYFLCWSPFITMKTLQHCFSMNVNAELLQGTAVLGILNSILNFIVYPLRKAELRNTFKAMLLPVKKRFLRMLCQS